MLRDSLLLEVVEEVSRKLSRKSYEKLLVDLKLFLLADLKDNDEFSGLTKYDLILETLRTFHNQHEILYGLYRRRLLSKELHNRLVQAGVDFADQKPDPEPTKTLENQKGTAGKSKDNSISVAKKAQNEEKEIVDNIKDAKPARKTIVWPRILALLTTLAVICAIVSGLNDTFSLLDRFFSGKTPIPTSDDIDSTLIATPVYSSNSIRLIPIGDQNIVVNLGSQTLFPSAVIPLNETVTVRFKILNNGSSPVTIKALVIGSRGPGVTCENPNTAKWSAPDVPFPTYNEIMILPGGEYEYQGSRAFYLSGEYFLEPIIQGTEGKWGGIQPFSCLSIIVDAPNSVETETVVVPTRGIPTNTPSFPEPVTKTSDRDGMTMVFVIEGEFTMGNTVEKAFADCQKYMMDCKSIWFEDESPPHQVYLNDFWIDQTEITKGMYALCVQSGACNSPSNPKYYNDNNYPVVYVSWQDAFNYCSWVGRRLPTEAEWEKVARGITTSVFPWGDQLDGNRVNFCDFRCSETDGYEVIDDGFNEAAPVGSFPDGASSYGVLDLAGNVWEWVSDSYDSVYYSHSPTENPSGPASNTLRIVRGGAWRSNTENIRNTVRWKNEFASSFDDVGFRCASDVQ